jgi:hypothetical protein
MKKCYSLRLAGEEGLITKNKGFNHISAEIIQRGAVNLFEQELALVLAGNKARGLYFFQKTFVIKPGSYTIDVRPEKDAYKRMTLIGPRRFFNTANFIRLKEIFLPESELDTLKCGKYLIDDTDDIPVPSQKVVIADLAPLLPCFPFGYSPDKYEDNYEFVKFDHATDAT